MTKPIDMPEAEQLAWVEVSTVTDLTPESLAELRRLLDDGSTRPWVAFRANDPNPGGRGWVGVTRDIDVDYDPDIFASQRCAPRDAALIAAAVNALPALLDAAARLAEVEERDALATKVARVRAMHVRHSDHRPAQIINGPWYCCARAQLGAVAMDDCNVCFGECWPCPTIRALDGTETDHG